jgi:hypothetical protein
VAGGVSPRYGFFGFGIERVIVQVIGVEVDFDGLEIRHEFLGYSVSVSSAAVLKVYDRTLQFLLNLIQGSGRH